MDYDSLEPEVRAHALVGYFLQSWALMEAKLNDVIGKSLGIDGVLQSILCSNLQLRAKIHIAKTAVNYEPLQKDRKHTYSNTLQSIDIKSNVRNMMAHDMFVVNSTKDGVEWLSVKAKGKLTYPKNDWNVQRFHQEVAEVDGFRQTLNEIQKAITNAKIVRLLLKHDLPSHWGGEPNMFRSHDPHSLAPLLGSLDTSIPKDADVPDEPDEKK